MKRKNWKRTAAFVTSVTMATTMMPAELGSIIVSAAADPNASAEIAELDWAQTKYDNLSKSYITSIKVNGSVQTNIIYNDNMKFMAGSSVEITSKVPLDIIFNHDNFSLKFADFATALQFAYQDGTFTRNTQQVSKEAVLAEILAYAGYSVDDKTFTAEWIDLNTNNPKVNVKFDAIETVNNGQYTYKFTMPDDNGNPDNAGIDTVTVKTSVQPIKVNFYESEEKRTEDRQTGEKVWTVTQLNGACNDYFGSTVISSSNPQVVGQYNNGIADSEVIVGDTVTITAAKPFVAHISDGNNEHNWINATNSFEKGQYKSVFTMPKYDGAGAGKVIIDIVKIDENYTYNVSGNKLLATADTGSFSNAVAASITAKYWDSANAYNADIEKTKGKEITGAIPNGSYVVVTAEREDRITAETQGVDKPFKVTKNGAVVYETNLANNNNNNPETLDDDDTVCGVNGEAGTYNAVYTVKGTDGKTYDISYSFRIAAQDELTAADVKFTLSAKENNAPINLNGVMASAADIVKERGKVENGEVVTFMLADGKAEEIAESGNSKYQFTVDPKVIIPDNNNYNNDGTKYYVKGTTSGSTLGRVYEFTIYVTDPEYGGSVDNPKEIPIKWRVVSYDEIPQWKNNRFNVENEYEDAQISIDELDKLEEVLTKAAQGNKAAEKAVEDKEVRYQWIKAPGANRTNEVQDELDEFANGLPTELGDYTVYIIYNDVIQATVDVAISKYNLGIYADESDLTYTYGHKFELTKPTVQKNADGEVVNAEIEDLKCSVYKAVEKEVEGIKVWTKGDEPVLQNKEVDKVGQLNAGHYYITFTGKSSDEDYVVKDDPQLLTVNPKSLDDPSIIILIDPFKYDGKTHDVVEERDPSNQSNFTVRDTDFDAEDPRHDISDLFKITEGGKQSTVGAHDCTFTLVSDVAITGGELAALAKQKVIKEINDLGNAATLEQVKTLLAGLNFKELNMCSNFKTYVTRTLPGRIVEDTDDENELKFTKSDGTTKLAGKDGIDALVTELNAANNYAAIGTNNSVGDVSCYDSHALNLNRERKALIGNFEGKTVDSEWHITADEANKEKVNANLKWNDDNTTLYDNGRIHLEITRNADDKINSDKTVAKIAKFGVVVEKEGKIAAPANYEGYTPDEIAAAEKFLKVGMANKDNSNGFIEGGYTKTSSPVTCASQTYKVNIRVKDVETGVWARPYVLYEDGTVSYGEVRYLDLTNEAIERLDVWTADSTPKAVRKADLDKYQTSNETLIKANVKSGYNTAENKFYVYSRYVDLETAGFTGVAQVADFGIVADREGDIAPGTDIAEVEKALKKETAKVVGHYNKNNAVLKENEYAASIKLGNAATGCWVRTYVDLGNGLVIYNKPIYINSASEYYGYEAAGTIKTQLEVKDAGTSNEVKRLVFTHDETANDRKNAVLAKAGAGVNASDIEVIKTGVVADKNNLFVQDNKMILNAGFLDGGQSNDFDKAYSAKISPKETNDISVRTYTIYKIKGVEVTVYGPVKTFEYSDSEGIKQVVAVRKGSSYYNDEEAVPSPADVDKLIPNITSNNYHLWTDSDRIVIDD